MNREIVPNEWKPVLFDREGNMGYLPRPDQDLRPILPKRKDTEKLGAQNSDLNRENRESVNNNTGSSSSLKYGRVLVHGENKQSGMESYYQAGEKAATTGKWSVNNHATTTTTSRHNGYEYNSNELMDYNHDDDFTTTTNVTTTHGYNDNNEYKEYTHNTNDIDTMDEEYNEEYNDYSHDGIYSYETNRGDHGGTSKKVAAHKTESTNCVRLAKYDQYEGQQNSRVGSHLYSTNNANTKINSAGMVYNNDDNYVGEEEYHDDHDYYADLGTNGPTYHDEYTNDNSHESTYNTQDHANYTQQQQHSSSSSATTSNSRYNNDKGGKKNYQKSWKGWTNSTKSCTTRQTAATTATTAANMIAPVGPSIFVPNDPTGIVHAANAAVAAAAANSVVANLPYYLTTPTATGGTNNSAAEMAAIAQTSAPFATPQVCTTMMGYSASNVNASHHVNTSCVLHTSTPNNYCGSGSNIMSNVVQNGNNFQSGANVQSAIVTGSDISLGSAVGGKNKNLQGNSQWNRKNSTSKNFVHTTMGYHVDSGSHASHAVSSQRGVTGKYTGGKTGKKF